MNRRGFLKGVTFTALATAVPALSSKGRFSPPLIGPDRELSDGDPFVEIFGDNWKLWQGNVDQIPVERQEMAREIARLADPGPHVMSKEQAERTRALLRVAVRKTGE